MSLILILMVLLATILGALFPQQILVLKPGLRPSFVGIMFLMGTLLRWTEIKVAAQEPRKLVPGLVGQYGLMPLLAWLASLAFDDSMIRAGILLLGCMPTAMASNVVTLLVNGRLSLAVFWTATATMAAPLVVGGLLPHLIDKHIALSPLDMAWTACWMVTMPVGGGILVRAVCEKKMPRWWEKASGWWEKASRHFATASIAFIVTITVAESGRLIFSVGPRLLAVLVAWNVVSYALAALAGKASGWPLPDRRALVLDVGMKNAGLGALLARDIGLGAGVPSTVYAVLCLLTATTIPLFIKAQPPQVPPVTPSA